MIQSVINPYTTLPIKTVMSQLAYKDCIDKDKVGDTHHCSHSQMCSLHCRRQSVKHHLPLANPCFLFPITTTFMLSAIIFARSYIHLEDRWNICLSKVIRDLLWYHLWKVMDRVRSHYDISQHTWMHPFWSHALIWFEISQEIHD